MKKTLIIAAILLCCACCGKNEPDNIRRGTASLERGVGSLEFTQYEPLADKPVTLHYYIPEEGDITKMRILFALHGADRDADRQISNWKEIAADKGFILLVPEFTKSYYPESLYQYGGVSASKTAFVPVEKEKWTYNLIEAMFDYIKEQTGNSASEYDIWGHSAGGQFVHRFMFYMPGARVATAIASNSGFYTAPLLEGYGSSVNGAAFGYPHSLGRTTFTEEDVENYLACNLVVHLGTEDRASTSAQDSSLPVDDGSMAQGQCRYDRGHFFFDTARTTAQRLGCDFNWQLREVAGIGHSSSGMVKTGPNAAAAILYN